MREPTVSLDFETYSEEDLLLAGPWRYATHPSTEVLCAGYKFPGEAPVVWKPNDPPPAPLLRHIEKGGIVRAWNAHFEMAIWEHLCTYMWEVELPVKQVRDTMADAALSAYPLKLEVCSRACGLPAGKDRDGHKSMLKLSKPRKPSKNNPATRWTYEMVPDDYERMYKYNAQDCVVEEGIGLVLPARVTGRELEIWFHDYEVNRRGIYLDKKMCENAIAMDTQATARLQERLQKATDGAIRSGNQVAVIKQFIEERNGIKLPDLTKPTLEELIAKGTPLDGPSKTAVDVRMQIGLKAAAKYKAAMARVGRRGRVQANFTYHRATTGRWGGRAVQYQNLKRPEPIHAPLQGEIAQSILDGDYDFMELAFGSVKVAVGDVVRGIAIPEPGKEFYAADYAGIEGRVVAWLAGDRAKVQRFHEYDAGLLKYDNYEFAAADIYLVDPSLVDKQMRFIGKVAELSLGFQGHVGAFLNMARNYGVNVPEKQAFSIVNKWRKAHPEICKSWTEFEKAAKRAIQNPRKAFRYGLVRYFMHKNALFAELPNGKLLCYPEARLRKGKIEFMAYVKGGWYRNSTYGGKLCENNTQATARELLAGAMLDAEAAGFPVVLHVHDEIVAEVEKGLGEFQRFCDIMARVPKWAKQGVMPLPVAVDGWIGERYAKR